MRTTINKNGKLLKNAIHGIRMAASTGYRTGYFLAKHPEIEYAGKHLQKNYRSTLFALAGILLAIIGLQLMKKS